LDRSPIVPLTGQAKTDYQRSYMRRRRAADHGQEPPEGALQTRHKLAAGAWQPTPALLSEVSYFIRARHRLRSGSIGEAVLEGLDFEEITTDQGRIGWKVCDEEWFEMCLRLRGIREFRRLERERPPPPPATKPEPPRVVRCLFCYRPSQEVARLVTNGAGAAICPECYAQAGPLFAAHRPLDTDGTPSDVDT
jgi:ClpX C4-type zinc finger